MSERWKLLQTSEACEVLLNRQTSNNDHKNCKNSIQFLRKLQHKIITNQQKKSSQTSEILFNNKTFNFGHKNLQKIYNGI